jgi:hypothetical protein
MYRTLEVANSYFSMIQLIFVRKTTFRQVTCDASLARVTTAANTPAVDSVRAAMDLGSQYIPVASAVAVDSAVVDYIAAVDNT